MSLHILNTAIVPWFSGSANTRLHEINLETARQLVADYEIVSHVGHAATASVLTGLLGQEVKMDRTPWDGSGFALIFQSHSRLEEGKVYTVEEMGTLKFGFRVMEIVKGPRSGLTLEAVSALAATEAGAKALEGLRVLGGDTGLMGTPGELAKVNGLDAVGVWENDTGNARMFVVNL